VPITQNIIILVHAMASNNQMSEELKIETKSGKIIYDSSWIAGVKYVENDNEDEESHNIYNEDETIEEYDEMDINEIADILQEKAYNNQETNQIDDYDEDNLGNEKEIDKIEVEDIDSNPSEEKEIEAEEEYEEE
jgi:hypothetical protein